MARPGPSLERMTQAVAKVQELIDDGVPRKEAISRAGLTLTTYYRWRSRIGMGEWPAIHKDWAGLARTWEPSGVLSELDGTKEYRLRREIVGALRQIYGQPVRRTSKASLDPLIWFLCIFTRACEAYDALDEESQEFLMEIREVVGKKRNFLDLYGATRALEPSLTTLMEEREVFAREAAAHGLGPLRDLRTARLVAALATIWNQFSGKRPSHTVDPSSQLPVSPFNDFFDSVRRHFLRDVEISDHAIMEAMQHISARIDWS